MPKVSCPPPDSYISVTIFTPRNIYCVYFRIEGDLAVSQPSEQVQEALKQLSVFQVPGDHQPQFVYT